MARTALAKAVPAAYQSLLAMSEQAATAAADAGIEPLTIELVRIRASQLNGCAFCLRMHVRDALGKGENVDRIAVLTAWRDTQYFTPAEQAALAIAEQITHIGSPPAQPDSDALNDQQAAALRWVAIVINAFNRVAISSHYEVTP